MTGISRTVMSRRRAPSRSIRTGGLPCTLAEDNELNREIAVELAEMTGITVDYAENGKIAPGKVLTIR